VIDPAARLCKGCGRTFEEVQHWTAMTPGQKRVVWRRITLDAKAWRFNKYAERAGESRAYATWMKSLGYRPVSTRHINEGQGDLLKVGEKVLAGCGFRTDRRAHAEIAAVLGMPVVTLELVDPRFYHLDTALAVLDDNTIAFYPPAFSQAAREQLRVLFPDAIVVGSADAYVLGLNVVSDGLHVVLPAAATGFAAQLRDSGFEPIGVDLSELLKGGGSVKCCTLEVFP